MLKDNLPKYHDCSFCGSGTAILIERKCTAGKSVTFDLLTYQCTCGESFTTTETDTISIRRFTIASRIQGRRDKRKNILKNIYGI